MPLPLHQDRIEELKKGLVGMVPHLSDEDELSIEVELEDDFEIIFEDSDDAF